MNKKKKFPICLIDCLPEVNYEDKSVEDFIRVAKNRCLNDKFLDNLILNGSEALAKFKKDLSDSHFENVDSTFLDKCLIDYALLAAFEDNEFISTSMEKQFVFLAQNVFAGFQLEYGLKTVVEKVYAQLAVAAFVRYQISLDKLEKIRSKKVINSVDISYVDRLLKDLDCSFRQWQMSINYFDSKNKPKLNINLKAENAFIASNQQNISNNKKNNEPQ